MGFCLSLHKNVATVNGPPGWYSFSPGNPLSKPIRGIILKWATFLTWSYLMHTNTNTWALLSSHQTFTKCAPVHKTAQQSRAISDFELQFYWWVIRSSANAIHSNHTNSKNDNNENHLHVTRFLREFLRSGRAEIDCSRPWTKDDVVLWSDVCTL